MKAVEELTILEQREAELIGKLDAVREQRHEVLRELQAESINRPLSIKQVAWLLEYNYDYLCTIGIPFEGGKIDYLDLREWVGEHRPRKARRLEKNYQQFIREAL